jgi:hypothetical protein
LPYFVMTAVVFQPTAEVLVKNVRLEFKERIEKKSWRQATQPGDTQHN